MFPHRILKELRSLVIRHDLLRDALTPNALEWLRSVSYTLRHCPFSLAIDELTHVLMNASRFRSAQTWEL